ncbi:MAG: TonB C-terminal domain-containing protein [Alphaproteobacteria bacterium]|nr:TonB C-terminal domain-containing protein [Alphaproteobacteria bacterium]
MKSSLHGHRDPLLLPLVVSVVGHVGMIVGFTGFTFLLTFCGDSKPIIDPDDAMEVAMVQLPKSRSRMPDRATRAPEPVGKPEPVAQPTPAPDVKHTSDLAVKTEKAEPKPGVDTRRLEDALKLLEQQERLAQMEAALGDLNQAATDPNSESDEVADVGAIGTPGDPEFARYIAQVRARFMEAFHPLQSIRDANPGIRCVIHITVETGTGRIVRFDVTRPSGVDAFDAAAQRAVEAVSSIPLPPEKYRDRMGRGYDIVFD